MHFFPSVILEGQLKLPVISGYCKGLLSGTAWYARSAFTSTALVPRHFWVQLQATGSHCSEPRQMQCSHYSSKDKQQN